MAKRTAESCPKCGSAWVVPIAYGFPDEETFAAAGRGEVEPGGCVIGGNDPNRACRDCTHQWTVPEDDETGPHATVR